MKVSTSTYISSFRFGNKLFNIEEDPKQLNNIDDLDKEIQMLELIRRLMIESEAPEEQYERINIYKDKPLTKEDLINNLIEFADKVE
mgnify:CR=1 FL=1